MKDPEKMTRQELLQQDRVQQSMYRFVNHLHVYRKQYWTGVVLVAFLILGTWAGFEYQNLQKIEESKLEELIVTDSVPNIKPHSKIKILSCADLFSDVMKRVHNNKSISSNFIM